MVVLSLPLSLSLSLSLSFSRYISRVDLLRLLIASQFTDIPSIQELTRPELARLVKREREGKR